MEALPDRQIIRHLESAFDCLCEGHAAGRDTRDERGAVLDASRALRGYARLLQKATSYRRNGQPSSPTGEYTPAFSRVQGDYVRFVAACSEKGRGDQERADFLEGLAALRQDAMEVRRNARLQLARSMVKRRGARSGRVHR